MAVARAGGLRKPRKQSYRTFPAYWNHPLLTADEERALLARVKDPAAAQEERLAARNELILKNQRLVVSIAVHRTTPFLGVEALVSAGNLGLIRAIEKFDLGRNVRFGTYAKNWVFQFMMVEIATAGFIVQTPPWIKKWVIQYRRLANAIASREGCAPTFDRLCNEMGIKPRRRACLEAAISLYNAEFWSYPFEHHPDFIQYDTTTSDDSWGWDDRELPDERCADLDAAVHHRETVDAMMAALTPREAHVLRLAFGLDGDEPASIREIARREGLSK